MKSEVDRKENGNIEIIITVPWSEIKPKYDKISQEAAKNLTVKGFRKGKAPKKIAEQNLNQEIIWQKVLETTLPETYAQAVKKESIKPIINPQIQLQKAVPDNELVFKVVTAEAPVFDLGNYKNDVKKLKEKNESKIWTPGQDEETGSKKEKQKADERVSLNQILTQLLKSINFDLPEIIVEEQTNKNLTQIIDQVKQVGMDIQKYAQSKNKSVEDVKKEARTEALNTLKLEFILEKIADAEKVVVTDKDIDNFINKLEDKKEKENAKNQRYYIASILKRQITLKTLLD